MCKWGPLHLQNGEAAPIRHLVLRVKEPSAGLTHYLAWELKSNNRFKWPRVNPVCPSNDLVAT